MFALVRGVVMGKWDRILKGALSIGLIAGSTGFYLNGRFQLTASYAIVVAPAISIHAPADGVLSHNVRIFSVVAAGSELASVRPTPANDPELRAISAELETVRADVTSLKRLISVAEEMQSETRTRQSVLGDRRMAHLKHVLQKANAELATKQAAMEGAEQARQRSLELCSQSLMTLQECDALKTKAEVDKREYESAADQVSIANFLLESSRNGADVGQDQGSEVTYVRQRRDELTLRVATLKQQLTTQEARASALEFRVAPPSISVPASGRSRIWSVFRGNSARIVKGDALFEMVDCDQIFVFAVVTKDRYESLHIGTPASVTIHSRTYSGKIAQLLGPYGTFAENRSMQPQPPVIVNSQDASNGAVAVEVPELASVLRGSCEVGVHAEVDFTD
jgi:hypothetical protein